MTQALGITSALLLTSREIGCRFAEWNTPLMTGQLAWGSDDEAYVKRLHVPLESNS